MAFYAGKRVTMSRKYRLTITFLCSVFFFTAFLSLNPTASYASPPQALVLEYDLTGQTLLVTITHKSSFPSSHYIKYVEILKNGKKAGSNTYESQPDKVTFTYTYKVPAVEGDTFDVTGTCSILGSKTVSYTVGKPVGTK